MSSISSTPVNNPNLNTQLGLTGQSPSTHASESHNSDGTTTIDASEEVNGQTVQVRVTAGTEDQAIAAAKSALTTASQATAGAAFSGSGQGLLPTGSEPPGVSSVAASVTNDSTQQASAQLETFHSGQTTDGTGSTPSAGAVATNEELDMTRRSDGSFSATGTGTGLSTVADAVTVTGTTAAAVFGEAEGNLDNNLHYGTPIAGTGTTVAAGVSSVTAAGSYKTTSTAAQAQAATRTYDSSGHATGPQYTGAATTSSDPSRPLATSLNAALQTVGLPGTRTGVGSTPPDSTLASVRTATHLIAGQTAGTISSGAAASGYAAALNSYITSKGKDPNNLSPADRIALTSAFGAAVGYNLNNGTVS